MKKRWNRIKTFFSKPYNVLLILFVIVLGFLVVIPLISIVKDTFIVHSSEKARVHQAVGTFTTYHWNRLFRSDFSKSLLWDPLRNSLVTSVWSCVVSILIGGSFAWLVSRSDMRWKKLLTKLFIFPYIMPSWTLALAWKNFFKNVEITGSNGIFYSLTHIQVPTWFAYGEFPIIMVTGMHYAPFAYILIGGIFKNMDANLEEAATILDTPRWKIMSRVTLPMIKPAILSTILLVFGSAMGSYPVPHYLGLTTLSTKYISLNSKYTGEASILAIIMMVFGVLILSLNQMSLKSRKNYTTVTGKSGQLTKINLGKVGKYVIGIIFIVVTFFTSIWPILLFALETFLPNPGDYSFLYTGDLANQRKMLKRRKN